MGIKEDIGRRIAEIREKQGLKQTEFAIELELGRSTISGLENGKDPLTKRNRAIICQKYNINENWLLTGEGDMLNPPPIDPEPETAEENRLLMLFRKLTTDTQEAVLKIIEKLAKGNGVKQATEVRENPSIYSTNHKKTRKRA